MDNQSKAVKAMEIENQEEAIEKTKYDIKTRKELIEEHVSNSQTWLDLEAAKSEVARLKEKLTQELGSDGE